METLAERLAAFATQLTFEAIPHYVREAAVAHVADAVGVGLAGASLRDFAAAAESLVVGQNGGASTVWTTGQRVAPEAAALVNGTILHGLDFDDTHQASVMHVSAVVAPTVLAMAEMLGTSGRDIITAAVAGYETMIRIGMAARGGFHERGFHPTGVCGAFGAVVVAGKLWGLSQEELVRAMGIVGSQASGIFEYLADGSWVKRLHPGWAAHAGIEAVRLARAGFLGPSTVLEGKFGLYKTHLGADFKPQLESWDTLGTVWETPNIAYKMYPACHFTHAFINGALEIARVCPPQEIKQIALKVSEGVVPIIAEPWSDKLAPRTDYDAKFSLPFCVSTAMIDQRVNVASFQPDSIARADVLTLAGHCSYEVDSESDYPESFPGWVIVSTKDGREFEQHVHHMLGTSENPVAIHQLKAKFLDNAQYASHITDPGGLWAFLGNIDNCPEMPNLQRWMSPDPAVRRPAVG